MEDLKQQYLEELKRLSNLEYRDEIKIAELTENFNGMSIEIRKKEKLLQQEQWAYLSTHPSKRLHSFCFDDDDEDYTSAITPDEPVLSTEEPDNSLSMGDEHLDTIPATESNEFIKSGVENLIPIPSESEGIPEHMCDVPSHDNSLPLDVSKDQIKDFSESNEEFSSTDDDSFSFDKIDYVEASPPDSELVSSKVMEIVIQEVDAFLAVEDEPTSSQFPKSYLDPEGDMLILEAFLNDDHSSDFKTKSSSTSLNSLLEETNNFDNSLPEFTTFSKTDCNFEEDIRLIEKLLYDNSSHRLPKEFVSANSDAKIKYFSPSPILVKYSDFLMEEIDLFCTSDYPMPPGIVDKDYDSERDILIPKDLPSNNTLSFVEKESFHFDISPFSRPPAKPPDGDIGILNIKMMGDISDQKAFMHKLMITLAPHQEKSPDLISYRCGTVKKFNTHCSHLKECPMLIHRQNTPPLDVLLFYFIPLDPLKLKNTKKRTKSDQNRTKTRSVAKPGKFRSSYSGWRKKN
uniref:Reverse transcriptase domain-containing protein n=1 Tax=Tanacetum cinerariifolium TaxID=118510 RepID=A0A6L2MQV4_TANCI|nr:hypothetical protein [Tanacetum cinerariifolium]